MRSLKVREPPMDSILIDRKNRSLLEPARSVPVAAEVDVVVAGGGPAGFGAALAASRSGAKTLLIERNGVLGGVSTAVMMNVWNTPSDRMTGIAKEVTFKLVERGAAYAGALVNFDPEALLDLEMELLLEAETQILLHTWVVSPIVIDGRAQGVIVQSKSGRQAIIAKAVVDASGDGDVAYAAGCPSVKGRETDHKMRPVNTLIRLAGVNMQEMLSYCRHHPDQFQSEPHHVVSPDSPVTRIMGFFDLVAEGRRQGEVPDEVHYLRFEGVDTRRGIVTVNSARVYNVDGTSMWDVTRGDIESRRQNKLLFAFIKRRIPGCQNSFVISSSATLGVRETRHILGEYLLTDDELGEKTYPTSIARLWKYMVKGFEGHSPDGGEGAAEDVENRTLKRPLRWFEIPYGVVVPRKIEGLTVGGRIISQTHSADAWTRGQYCCMVTGQAAGTAAALAAMRNTVPRKLEVSRVQRALIRQGVDIGEVGQKYAEP